jgi:sugar O-acyltransferase (sialic acid O-acetyltransferase NeuD family)
MSGILILGAGGHAKVVADILRCQGLRVAGFLDDDPQTWGTTRLGLSVLGAIASFADYQPDGLVLGIGANQVRGQLVERLGPAVQALWCNAIHPRATVTASVRLGRGVVIVAGAVVNPDTVLGDHVIINTGATVDHDCVIGDYVHIAPGVHVCGGVQIGSYAFIGVGAALTPGRRVGAQATVGAGAVVVRDVPPGVTAKGIPARW